jgi:hypothetical protein
MIVFFLKKIDKFMLLLECFCNCFCFLYLISTSVFFYFNQDKKHSLSVFSSQDPQHQRLEKKCDRICKKPRYYLALIDCSLSFFSIDRMGFVILIGRANTQVHGKYNYMLLSKSGFILFRMGLQCYFNKFLNKFTRNNHNESQKKILIGLSPTFHCIFLYLSP